MSMLNSPELEPRLSVGQHISYAAPIMMVTFLLSPLGVVQGLYAKYFGISLSTIATVLLISRLFDALTDPLIGYWSDRYQTQFGTRKPFVLFGGLLFSISSYCLYVPIDVSVVGGERVVSASYFLIWLLLFYFAWTLVEIPHMAWGSEIALNSHAKNKLYSLRAMAGNLGTFFFYLVPFLPFFTSRDLTPQTLQWTALIAGGLMIPALYVCIHRTPSGERKPYRPVGRSDLRSLIHEIQSNKPMLSFFVAFFLFSCGSGMWFTLIFIFIDSYLILGQHFAGLTIIALLVSSAMLPGWYHLANRLGKKWVLGLGAMFYGMGAFLTGLLEPSEVSVVGLALVLILAYLSGGPAIGPSLLSDLIDYSAWRTRRERSATYFALYAFVLKAALALGGAMGLGIAGGFGFNPAAEIHSEDAVWGLRLATSWLPAALMLASMLFIYFIPINTRRHKIVRRRLDAYAAREPKQSTKLFIH